ncbi:MAG: hypothetical protein JWN13_2668, partial [Betaproteobacteria bacterium]|nr:hypothetical protein [Betaproteobacteria bacterium]
VEMVTELEIIPYLNYGSHLTQGSSRLQTKPGVRQTL